MASLRYYLENIKKGKAINYEQFLLQLPDDFRSMSNKTFVTKLVSSKPKQWKVSCDNKTFEELWQLSEPTSDRVHAAQLGDSHNHRVTANLLMVYHKELTDQVPSVVYISKEHVLQSFNSQSKLLLIENEENFICHDDFCKTVSQFMDADINVSNTDIALGSGNRVTSELLIDWYKNYEVILCAFDYDLGGLRMFKTLTGRLGEKVKFVQPDDYSDMMDLFRKKPDKDEKLLKSISLAEELGFKKLARTIFKTRCFMEQEILLNGV